MSTTELNAEDLAAYEQLQDPDANCNGLAETFDWGEELQTNVLGALLVDRQFLGDHADLIKATHFKDKAHQAIAKVLLGHFKKYKQVPSKVIINEELIRIVREDRLYYLAQLNKAYSTYEPGLETRDYMRDRILGFARMCRIKEGMHEAIKQMTSPKDGEVDWDKIHETLKSAILVPQNYDLGLDYFLTLEERYARLGDEADGMEVFSTGLASLDKAMTNGGMRRGEIHGVMSPPGVGKSLFLAQIAVVNVIAGKKVLFVSLEMGQDDIAQRLDAQLAESDIRTLLVRKDEVIARVKEHVEDLEDKRRLVIKQFPSGTANVDTIRAFFERLQMFGFRPDIVIVDYVGEMKDVQGIPTYESRERLVRDLRGFAVEQDVLVVTAFQPNRDAKQAMEVGVIDDSMLADAYGQLRPLDGLWTLNQSQADKDQDLGRLYVAKNRNGESRTTYHVSYDPKTLRIGEVSKEKYHARLGDWKKPQSSEAEMKSFFAAKKRIAE